MDIKELTEKHLLSSVDCNVIECGKESCVVGKVVYHPQGYFEGKMALHYVYSGSGEIECKGKVHSVKAGDAFLVPSEDETWYRASKNNPWQYYWVVLSGNIALEFMKNVGLCADKPVLTIGLQSELKAMFNSLADAFFAFGVDDFAVKGYTYLIFSKILHRQEHKEEKETASNAYIKQAITFIGNNYFNEIKISHIANDLNINSNYLGNLFRKLLGKSPKQYLREVRMSNACRLLVDTSQSITSVAKMVGFHDALYFSKEFKAYSRLAPTEFREKYKKWN